MIWFVGTIHVIVCIVLIGVVLLQQGKSADLAGAFGGQGSQTAFGPRGAANLLTKVTTWAAILFMFTSIGLTVLIQRSTGPRSVLSGSRPPRPPQPSPAGGLPQVEIRHFPVVHGQGRPCSRLPASRSRTIHYQQAHSQEYQQKHRGMGQHASVSQRVYVHKGIGIESAHGAPCQHIYQVNAGINQPSDCILPAQFVRGAKSSQ